jgi:hypothetical protein
MANIRQTERRVSFRIVLTSKLNMFYYKPIEAENQEKIDRKSAL